jgi:hypothetical protein
MAESGGNRRRGRITRRPVGGFAWHSSTRSQIQRCGVRSRALFFSRFARLQRSGQTRISNAGLRSLHAPAAPGNACTSDFHCHHVFRAETPSARDNTLSPTTCARLQRSPHRQFNRPDTTAYAQSGRLSARHTIIYRPSVRSSSHDILPN